MDDYQTYIHKSRYAKWRHDNFRRESWTETVSRMHSFIDKHLEHKYSKRIQKKFKDTNVLTEVENFNIMPSMRLLMTAGEAVERDNIAAYNCAYTPVDSIKVFPEVLYILMNGTGIGFSVERQYINQLPDIPKEIVNVEDIVVVRDSKAGWFRAFRSILFSLYNGEVPKWDLSKVRPAGARLKTFGGRASGPEPLNELFEYAVEVFKNSAGRKLNSLECHDLICKIASVVVVGGVRRSALISLSNLSDPRMRTAKTGEWHYAYPYRSYANNSVCYTEHPDVAVFMDEMKNLYESKCGERGIFSRPAAQKQVAKNNRRDATYEFGTNPCSEILLRPKEFCNLTEVVVREADTAEDLKRKIRAATILGTIQSTLTDFKHISKEWKDNCEEERLLGVSLTGIMDHSVLSKCKDTLGSLLQELREEAVKTNKEWASILNINPSAAITCVKPSGTVSQLVNSSSGIHPRFSGYYLRRVRGDKKDPLTNFLQDQKVPWEKDKFNPEHIVFSFPIASAKNAKTAEQIGALEQLELWKMYAENWCEHKPSCTVYYRDTEWLDVMSWVYKNFDLISGISFLPYSDHTYEQAPYEQITKEEYTKYTSTFPSIDWDIFDLMYEVDDNTTSSQEFACIGNMCEVL